MTQPKCCLFFAERGTQYFQAFPPMVVERGDAKSAGWSEFGLRIFSYAYHPTQIHLPPPSIS